MPPRDSFLRFQSERGEGGVGGMRASMTVGLVKRHSALMRPREGASVRRKTQSSAVIGLTFHCPLEKGSSLVPLSSAKSA